MPLGTGTNMKVKRLLTIVLFWVSFAAGLGVTEAYGQELRLNDVRSEGAVKQTRHQGTASSGV